MKGGRLIKSSTEVVGRGDRNSSVAGAVIRHMWLVNVFLRQPPAGNVPCPRGSAPSTLLTRKAELQKLILNDCTGA